MTSLGALSSLPIEEAGDSLLKQGILGVVIIGLVVALVWVTRKMVSVQEARIADKQEVARVHEEVSKAQEARNEEVSKVQELRVSDQQAVTKMLIEFSNSLKDVLRESKSASEAQAREIKGLADAFARGVDELRRSLESHGDVVGESAKLLGQMQLSQGEAFANLKRLTDDLRDLAARRRPTS